MVPTEVIDVAGRPTVTLRELLRTGLRAVVVGINPSPVSVKAGHYYQGRLGKQFWQRLQQAQIVRDLTPGCEDEDAFAQGLGFADLLRYPTPNAREIRRRELADAVPELTRRLRPTGCSRLLFVFKTARDAAAPLSTQGFELLSMPPPFAPRADVAKLLAALRVQLGPSL